MQRPVQAGRLAVGVMLVAACLASVPASGQATPRASEFGRVDVTVPERTDRGRWDGTWFYVYRDGRMALWLRTVDGGVQAKVRFQSTASTEAFETDWSGVADYELAGAPGRFRLTFDRSDADTLEGRWEWTVEARRGGRYERGRFTAYRSGDGRGLVLRFHDYEKIIRKGDREVRYEGSPAWTFRKVSKRLAPWDEVAG